MIFYIVLTIHIILCLTLIGLVLIQQGKGADLGAAFGSGGSNSFFGASGATAFITKLTTGIAISFMITSLLLINLYTAHIRDGGVNLLPISDPIKDVLDKNAPQKPVAPVENSTGK